MESLPSAGDAEDVIALPLAVSRFAPPATLHPQPNLGKLYQITSALSLLFYQVQSYLFGTTIFTLLLKIDI